MEKKVVMNTRLAVAAVVLLFGLLLTGQEATAAEEAATATATTEAATATDAAEAPPSKASYGKSSKGDCEVPAGTCDVKVAADPKRPGAEANPYTRGCSKITGCRD